MPLREQVTRVALKNYRSIAACDLMPGALTFLVGPNGSGKSNFLDSFRFVSESLRTSVDHAIRRRGGINQVRRRSTGHPTHFGMRFEVRLTEGDGVYGFEIGAAPDGGFSIRREHGRLAGHHFDRRTKPDGETFTSSLGVPLPRVVSDRFALVALSGAPEFRPLFDFLAKIEVYNLNPEAIREPQTPDAGDVLLRDGANVASALSRLENRDPEAKQRVVEYLQAIVPGITGAERKALGSRETIEFSQKVEGARHAWKFDAASMSDGTLRALGVLVALFQGSHEPHLAMIGLEEPESALHPGAAGALRDALFEASQQRQIIVTSHSPELLDSDDVTDHQLLSVISDESKTVIGPVDEANRDLLKKRLFTAGELLKRGQLEPNRDSLVTDAEQLSLFEGIAE